MNPAILQESHIFPRLLYRYMAKCIQQYALNPKLHIIKSDNDEKPVRRPDQWKEYLLCKDCEFLFSRYESLAGMMLNKSKVYLFIDELERQSQMLLRAEPGEGHVIEARRLNDSRTVDQLTYLALSIFWRWTQLCKPNPLKTYAEPLRQYLLDPKKLPSKMDLRLQVICPRTGIDTDPVEFDHTLTSPDIFRFDLPSGSRGWLYQFQIFDMIFQVWLGARDSSDLVGSFARNGMYEVNTVAWKAIFDHLKEKYATLIPSA